MSFRGPCPRCGDLLTEFMRQCPGCGARTGLAPAYRPAPRARRVTPPTEPPLVIELPPCTSTRYVVRECEGYRIASPIKRLAYHALPGIECVVLDTAWNHRVVASFASEDAANMLGRSVMFERARQAAATRCDLLNRLAREAQGAVA